MIKYLIFNISEIYKVNFDEIKETSNDTLRISVDATKTLIKWDEDEAPTFVALLTTAEGTYTHEQILEILSTDLWTDYNIMNNLK
jgi:hypothetical protein